MNNKVKERREEMRMTQEELAEKAKISRQTIYSIENGKAENLTIGTMTNIANALETTVSYLFLL